LIKDNTTLGQDNKYKTSIRTTIQEATCK